MQLFYDTETTGLVQYVEKDGPNKGEPIRSDDPRQPYLTQICGVLMDDDGREIANIDFLIKPDGWTISPEVEALNGITTALCQEKGVPLSIAVDEFWFLFKKCKVLIAHNEAFDRRIIRIALKRLKEDERADEWKAFEGGFCTCSKATDIVCVPRNSGRGYKKPTLTEAYQHFFGSDIPDKHTALGDVRALIPLHKKLLEAGAA